MGDAPQISYEEYIQGDRYTLQDIYYNLIADLSTWHTALAEGELQGSINARALIKFFGTARTFYSFSRHNLKRFCTDKQMERLAEILKPGRRMDNKTIFLAYEVYDIFMHFADKSKLTELVSKRWKGEFANARRRLGLQKSGGGEE